MRTCAMRRAGRCLALALAFAAFGAGAVDPSAAPAPVRYALSIRDGQVARAQRTLVVPHGAPVEIEWSADRHTTVHLEGYDLSVSVHPGEPTTMSFRAHVTGRFPVHAHAGARKGSPTTHAHGRDVLTRLEVHPK